MDGYITKGQALYLVSYAANTGNLEQAKKLLDAYCEWNKSDRGSYIISEKLLEVLASSPSSCVYILELRTGSTACGLIDCKKCEKENLEWLKSWGC